MRLYGNQFLKRLFGTLVGIGFFVFGLFAIFGGEESLPDATKDRALGYGITLIVVGVIAIVASWAAKNLDDIWCRQPRRWRD